jgi:hypothetical protein
VRSFCGSDLGSTRSMARIARRFDLQALAMICHDAVMPSRPSLRVPT